ncbi:MAG: hypothetical protein B6I36_05195 [Desulfobacteraceae bacterium 4572_35.1]|nr:MAG: hypothetical protein B6I36_05195 [Desulfobacteraceae bacterium 4572_35.1]
MKIKLKNLGALKLAEFELGDLTIVCGGNNTGKTYATYALYGFLVFWRDVYSIPVPSHYIDALLSNGSVRLPLQDFIMRRNEFLKQASEQYSKSLAFVFAANKKNFENTEVHFELDAPNECPSSEFLRQFGTSKKQIFSVIKAKNSSELEVTLLVQTGEEELDPKGIHQIIGDALQDVLFGHLFPRPFIASAERTGAAIFRKELNFARNRLLEEVGSMDQDLNPFQLINKVYSDYAMPVKHNVDFARQIEDVAKKESFIAHDHPALLEQFSEIIGGSYKVTSNDELYFVPDGNRRIRLTMDESSSAVRSMLDIGFYLKHVAKTGDLLIVDEPELNLHPENQRRVARLFARLVNIGVNVYLTTHSDYIIKELNTVIMMSNSSTLIRGIRVEEGYVEEELLTSDQVRVYIAEKQLLLLDGNKKRTPCQTLVPADVDSELGIEARSFDTTIDEMNRIQEALYFTMEGEDV